MSDLVSLWSSREWRERAEAWIRSMLDAAGIALTGEVTQPRVRFWSTQLRVPTDHGIVWFKENAPPQAFEAALTVLLQRLSPDQAIPPIATDEDHGWLLLPDAGRTLRESGQASVENWVRVLSEFGALQRSLEGHAEAVLASGVQAMPTTESLAYLDRQVAALAALPEGDARRLGPADVDAITAGRPLIGAAAEELAASGIRASLQHNDLHDNNAFAPTGAPLRFFDFGDAVWAHPFAVTLIATISLRDRLGTTPGDSTERRILDAYLENWTDVAPLGRLRLLLPAAERIGCLHRSESWRRLLDAVPLETVEQEWRDAQSWGLTGAAAT